MLSTILSTKRSAVQCTRKSVLLSLVNSVLWSMKRNVDRFRLLCAVSNTKLSAQEAETITAAEAISAAEATADIQSGKGRLIQDGMGGLMAIMGIEVAQGAQRFRAVSAKRSPSQSAEKFPGNSVEQL